MLARARLVADGNTEGDVDPSLAYAPTPDAASLRAALVYAARYGWFLWSGDVSQAFLSALLSEAGDGEEILMRLPAEMGGQVVYVEDSSFSLRFAGLEIKLFLDSGGGSKSLLIHSEERIRCLLEDFEMSDAKKKATPAVDSHRKEWVRRIGAGVEPDRDNTEVDPEFKVKSALGSLQYISTICRPDIAESVGSAARRPFRDLAISMIRRIFRCLNGTLDWGIADNKEGGLAMESAHARYLGDFVADSHFPSAVTFSDSSFGSCPSLGRSVSGTLLTLFGTPIHWKSARQNCVTRSTPHAETLALCDGIQISHSIGFLGILGDLPCQLEQCPTTPPVLADCQPAERQARSPDLTKGARHYHVSHHFARDFSDLIACIPTALVRADALNKPLSRKGHEAVLVTTPTLEKRDKTDEDDEE